mmetsp:Transcript_16474/g.30381  ORF Transcript_16474/g.30381 Transcript_16474/m.30381 type:complete len:232 (-) Transcript_16474:299-994(-)
MSSMIFLRITTFISKGFAPSARLASEPDSCMSDPRSSRFGSSSMSTIRFSWSKSRSDWLEHSRRRDSRSNHGRSLDDSDSFSVFSCGLSTSVSKLSKWLNLLSISCTLHCPDLKLATSWETFSCCSRKRGMREDCRSTSSTIRLSMELQRCSKSSSRPFTECRTCCTTNWDLSAESLASANLSTICCVYWLKTASNCWRNCCISSDCLHSKAARSRFSVSMSLRISMIFAS